LDKVRKELEIIERKKNKGTKNNKNDKKEKRKNWARKFRTRGVNKRR